jgi:hypothetical protein
MGKCVKLDRGNSRSFITPTSKTSNGIFWYSLPKIDLDLNYNPNIIKAKIFPYFEYLIIVVKPTTMSNLVTSKAIFLSSLSLTRSISIPLLIFVFLWNLFFEQEDRYDYHTIIVVGENNARSN